MGLRNFIKKILLEETSVSFPIKLSGSFKVPDNISSKGDALHSFDRRKSDKFGGYMLRGTPIPSKWSPYVKLDQGKGINQVLEELYKKGVSADITDLTVDVNNDYSVNWEATIDESSDGKSYVGVASRGSAGGGADSRAESQIGPLKSKNPKNCNWTEVLDLNVTSPIKIRQFFLKYTLCEEGEEPNDETIEKENDLEQEFMDWEPGIYRIEGDEDWIYKLNDDNMWEAKKTDSSDFLLLKDSLSSDKYEEALENLKMAVLESDKEGETTSLEEHITRIIKEVTSPQAKVLSMLRGIGFKKTASAVGGVENLFKILGKNKELVMEYLLSFFDNLNLSYFRGNPILSQGYETFLEKSSSFWGGTINVYDDDILYILKDVPYELYKEYRKDLLKELIRRYPEINDGNEVYVYKNRGKYGRIDKFYVDEKNNEEKTINEDVSLQEKLMKKLQTNGLKKTIGSVGGKENFKKIMQKYDYYTQDILQEILNYELSELREESEDWGLGEMSELNQLNSIQELKIVNLVKVNNITLYVDIHANNNRKDFDDIMSELRYRLQSNWNDKILLLENEIWNVSDYGPGIDW